MKGVKEMFQIEDIVRIVSDGIFKGQESRILKVDLAINHPRRTKDWYLLAVSHANGVFHGWFEASEIELVQAKVL